jgi:hypothetical protein
MGIEKFLGLWRISGRGSEEPNGCKFIEKILGLFWVSSSFVNGRMNIVRIYEFVLS